MKRFLSLKTTTLISFLLISSFTATATFTAKALTPGRSEWTLNIGGLVDYPLNLTLDDLKEIPQVTEEATIYCVSFPDQIVTTGIWKGVSLASLLDRVGVQSSAVKVAFFAADGYATDLNLPTATSGSVIVAFEKDGMPLSETLRLVVPGKWGYKWISQLTTISLVDFDFKGTYESQGYSDENVNVGSEAVPSAASVRAIQTYSNLTQTTNTTIPSFNPEATNSTGKIPVENFKPKLEPTTFGSMSEIAWIIIVVIVAAFAALLIFSKNRKGKERFLTGKPATTSTATSKQMA